eukprot:CAMPEP_0197450722 /NCGR_PEP_ID=MMETSP1175-20131217/26297_1 /TAXON_ID=1003142 /ORGANISM="Triceratium dubium, Strain CCMP147" /LENGTH=675 /DNA_ID=CAMNT_0042983205 /DNA_START=113 /DNA_END=2137 /DNA_ORIENTATION=+
MVFTDQMLRPRTVLPIPDDLEPPNINLSCSKLGQPGQELDCCASLPLSPLGIWCLEGCGDFLQTVQSTLAYSNDDNDLYNKIAQLVLIGALPGNFVSARGRRNINIKAVPLEVNSNSTVAEVINACGEMQMVRRLQEQSTIVANQVSRCMEIWLNLPKGSMMRAHERGKSSSLRLLDYPAGIAVPPHTDGSVYTIIYNDCNMMIQSPDDDSVWYDLSTNKTSGGRLLLVLGSHLDQAIPARLEQLRRGSDIDHQLQAPVHRISACGTPRRALTLHIKADTVWPSLLEDLNRSNHKPDSILTSEDYHDRDISSDAELYSHYLCAQHVPSAEDILDHLKLLSSIVMGYDHRYSSVIRAGKDDDTGCSTPDCNSSFSSLSDCSPPAVINGEGCSYRLPSVHCTGYWQLQTKRYRTFLLIHKQQHSLDAAGILPPREIHHVWLCHQLHPLCYKADCQKFFSGRILGHMNRHFSLRGCSKFHELWEAETGMPWPTEEELRREVEMAKTLPATTSNNDSLPVITANLWHNYDGLLRLYDELRKESPGMFAFGTKEADSLLNDARLNYARFLIAASYASTVGMKVTPPGPVDLVWHTHQTNPGNYHDTMQREFATAPIDHVPCGALNPPPDNGKEWLEMTDKIWTDLYGHGVNVQGRAIHCCFGSDPRPTELVLLENESVAW